MNNPLAAKPKPTAAATASSAMTDITKPPGLNKANEEGEEEEIKASAEESKGENSAAADDEQAENNEGSEHSEEQKSQQ